MSHQNEAGAQSMQTHNTHLQEMMIDVYKDVFLVFLKAVGRSEAFEEEYLIKRNLVSYLTTFENAVLHIVALYVALFVVFCQLSYQ